MPSRFHRDKRSKHQLHSELDDIKGIGPKTKDQLLSKFKSVKRIKEADMPQLSEAVGQAKAKIVFDHFHGNEKEEKSRISAINRLFLVNR